MPTNRPRESLASRHILYGPSGTAAAQWAMGEHASARYAAGAPLGCAVPGDVLWVVQFHAWRPMLVARIPADHVVNSSRASEILGTRVIGDEPVYIVADAGRAEPAASVEIADLVPDLRFIGRTSRLRADFGANHFHAPRMLDAASIPLLERRWAERADWDRDSRNASQAVLARLVPDVERRRRLLGWFARAVEHAHAAAPNGWAVVLLPDRARLFVNWTIFATVHVGALWMNLGNGILTSDDIALLTRTPGWRWEDLPDTSEDVAKPGNWQSGYLKDVDDDDTVALRLERAMYRQIARAARHTGLRSSTRDGWSPGLLEAIEHTLRIPLPRPTWLAKASG